MTDDAGFPSGRWPSRRSCPSEAGGKYTHCGWIRRYGYHQTGNWFDARLTRPPGSVVMLFQPENACNMTEGLVSSNAFAGLLWGIQ